MADNSISNNITTLETKYNELMYLGTSMCEILNDLNTLVEGLLKIAKRYETLTNEIVEMTKEN